MLKIIFKKLGIAKEFFCMIKDRKIWLFIPLMIAILLIAIFMFVVEMPALFPFFYAVF